MHNASTKQCGYHLILSSLSKQVFVHIQFVCNLRKNRKMRLRHPRMCEIDCKI